MLQGTHPTHYVYSPHCWGAPLLRDPAYNAMAICGPRQPRYNGAALYLSFSLYINIHWI